MAHLLNVMMLTTLLQGWLDVCKSSFAAQRGDLLPVALLGPCSSPYAQSANRAQQSARHGLRPSARPPRKTISKNFYAQRAIPIDRHGVMWPVQHVVATYQKEPCVAAANNTVRTASPADSRISSASFLTISAGRGALIGRVGDCRTWHNLSLLGASHDVAQSPVGGRLSIAINHQERTHATGPTRPHRSSSQPAKIPRDFSHSSQKS